MLVGVAQIEPRLGELDRNRELCLARLEEAAAAGCSLLVLPECSSSGYMFDSAAEASPYAQELDGPFVTPLPRRAADTACTASPGCSSGTATRYATQRCSWGPTASSGGTGRATFRSSASTASLLAGDEVEVFDTPIGRIGIEICYDLRFPELTRAIALRGADIVAHPTNWPMAARSNADVLTRARAHENHVFVLTSNRVGHERSAEFCGWSQVCDVWGTRIAEQGETGEGVAFAEIDVAQAREKDILPIPGEYEMYLFGHRRPELYGALVEEHATVNRRQEVA